MNGAQGLHGRLSSCVSIPRQTSGLSSSLRTHSAHLDARKCSVSSPGASASRHLRASPDSGQSPRESSELASPIRVASGRPSPLLTGVRFRTLNRRRVNLAPSRRCIARGSRDWSPSSRLRALQTCLRIADLVTPAIHLHRSPRQGVRCTICQQIANPALRPFSVRLAWPPDLGHARRA